MEGEEKKGKEELDALDGIIKELEGLDKGYILITTDNTSGLAKDNKPDAQLIMRSNLVDALVAHNIQIVLRQLRQRGA